MNILKNITNEQSTPNVKVLKALNTLMEEGVISFEDGVINFNIDMVFNFKGNLKINCDKHVFISSGKGNDPDREDGVKHSVWLNPSFDEDGNPVAILEPEESWEQ
tara:strand:- start:96 stop:410 length:315 start_codon:yes stop_codon:yes gene_type:complete